VFRRVLSVLGGETSLDMLDTELRRKLAWLIAIRAIVSTILLGSATLIELTAPGSFPIGRFFFLIGLTYALTIFYSATLRYADRVRGLVNVQLAGDALIVSAFIYLTGGVTSYFSLLYLLPIVAGSTVQLRRGGLLVATLSTLLYVGVVAMQYSTADSLLHTGPVVTLPSRLVAQYTVAVNVFCFFAVALLSGSLAEELRSASARLVLASTEIADLQALNQHVINSLPSGLVTTDTQQRVLTFNRAAESITGVTLTSAVGRPIADVLQLPPSIIAALDEPHADWRKRRYEFNYRTADRRGDIELGITATHLETPGGRAGFLVTFQDVTLIKRLERDSAMQQRLAAVGEMAAGIAHEIRNPLASMSGSIQILRQELPLTAEQEQLMDIVLRESDRLNSTIRSFLAYARPQRVAMARLDVRRTRNDAALLLRNSSEVNDRHIVAVDLPPRELWYDADEGQIKQIVWNLATNGIRAMPDGGRLRLAGTADASSGGVVITVQDEGIGMAPEELEGLFQPFHGGFAKGSGLGLAIVHRIVTDYKGEIQVSSKSGGGTTVSVRLPAQRPVATV
jgi:two-component system, NtrC family, sensor histidine kinase PilS